MKYGIDITGLRPPGMDLYAQVCAWALARAHARSGDPAEIAGYLGAGAVFDEALAEFGVAYADQTERDHAALVAAVRAGRIAAETGDLRTPPNDGRMARADHRPALPGRRGAGLRWHPEVEMAVAIRRGRRRHVDAAETFEPLEIAEDHCKGCGLCVDVCPKHVLELDTTLVNRLGYHPVRLTDAAACTSCALCARICPDAVFTVYARPKER